MAISGDIRFNPTTTGQNVHRSGGVRGDDIVKDPAQSDQFSRAEGTDRVGRPQFAQERGEVRHKKHHDKPWHAQTRDSNNYSAINAAGAAGGMAAAVAVSQLKYPDGRWNLGALADKALAERNFPTTYPADVMAQVDAIKGPATAADGVKVVDTRGDKDCAVDNKTTRDVDQIASAQLLGTNLATDPIRLRVKFTDTDALAPKGSPLDRHMRDVTTSLYTPDKIYNLAPEKLSTDYISLNEGQDRLTTCVEFVVDAKGNMSEEKVFQAMASNKAQLDYPTIGDWLEGKTTEMPDKLKADPAIAEQIKIQNEVSQRLQRARNESGALNFASNEVKIHCENGNAVGVEKTNIQLSNKLVENEMVTANQVISRFLRAQNHPDRPNHPQGYPSIQRVVERPAQDKWSRICAVAAQEGYKLPSNVNDENAGKALGAALRDHEQKDPAGFGEFSTSVVKLIGRGKYVAVAPGEEPPGHFGMGITDYVQSTASMRRYGDTVNARIVKAAMQDKDSPYSQSELQQIADELTNREQDSKKAERQAEKMVVATMLEPHIGETYSGVVTGVKGKDVWVKIGNPPVEGHLDGASGAQVGDKIKEMTLSSVNVAEGKIDFRRH